MHRTMFMHRFNGSVDSRFPRCSIRRVCVVGFGAREHTHQRPAETIRRSLRQLSTFLATIIGRLQEDKSLGNICVSSQLTRNLATTVKCSPKKDHSGSDAND